MILNTSDRKSIRAAEKAAATAERERGEVVVEMMATVQRRRYVWEKLEAAGIFSTTFSADPGTMAFNEGQRNQGLVLLNDVIQYCPEQFIEAMREANGRRTELNARTGTEPSDGQRSSSEDSGGDAEGAGESGAEAA